MIRETPKRKPEERTFTFKGIPEDLYEKILAESQETGLTMKMTVFQILKKYFHSGIHWHITDVPEELDVSIEGYALLTERTKEKQIVYDLCEMYEIKEPE